MVYEPWHYYEREEACQHLACARHRADNAAMQRQAMRENVLESPPAAEGYTTAKPRRVKVREDVLAAQAPVRSRGKETAPTASQARSSSPSDNARRYPRQGAPSQGAMVSYQRAADEHRGAARRSDATKKNRDDLAASGKKEPFDGAAHRPSATAKAHAVKEIAQVPLEPSTQRQIGLKPTPPPPLLVAPRNAKTQELPGEKSWTPIHEPPAGKAVVAAAKREGSPTADGWRRRDPEDVRKDAAGPLLPNEPDRETPSQLKIVP
jgi:hypothetical protein